MKKIGKYIVELIVIVVGITLSFLVEEWREENEREHSTELVLKGIKKEMISNNEQLENVIKWGRKGRRASLKLMELFAQQHVQVNEDTLHLYLRDLEMNYTFNPQLGILESAIASGQINYLHDEELKGMLSGFKDLVMDVNESTDEFKSIRNDQYYPLIDEYLSVRKTWSTYYSELEGSKFKTDVAGLFGDQELETVLTHLTILKRQGIEEQSDLLQKINTIIELVDNELE